MAFPASNDKHTCSSKELQFRRVMYRITEKCRMTGPVLERERIYENVMLQLILGVKILNSQGRRTSKIAPM